MPRGIGYKEPEAVKKQSDDVRDDIAALSDDEKKRKRVEANTKENLKRVMEEDKPARSVSEAETMKTREKTGTVSSGRKVQELQRKIADRRAELAELKRRKVDPSSYLEASRNANKLIDRWKSEIDTLQGAK